VIVETGPGGNGPTGVEAARAVVAIPRPKAMTRTANPTRTRLRRDGFVRALAEVMLSTVLSEGAARPGQVPLHRPRAEEESGSISACDKNRPAACSVASEKCTEREQAGSQRNQSHGSVQEPPPWQKA
jgi:hypothetical protein